MEVRPDEWDALLRRLGVTDVYYSRGYVEASALLVEGDAVFLHLPGDVLFPAILRADPPDVVTPYGYGGPLPVGEGAGAQEAYARWCARRGVLTSFVVHHPLFANAGVLGVRTTPLAGTVAWALDAEDLLVGMHRHHRRVVRRALDAGLEATVLERPADLSPFVEVYEQTMRRNAADPFYLFGEAYWAALAREVPLVQVDVTRGGELLGAVLGMGEPPWLHYHLGGVADAGRGSGASHLGLLTLARWGAENGYEALHLGGGLGGRADSLLEFKRRFAPGGLLRSSVGKAVHDVAAYEALTGGPPDYEAFFPAYRRPR